MKKLFLQSGKPMIGEFPEEPIWHLIPNNPSGDSIVDSYHAAVSAAKASAVEVVNPEAILTWDDREVWFFEHRAMAEDKLYDLPKGWTVEIKEACASDCCSDNGCCEHCREPVKIARLIPTSESAQDDYSLPEHLVEPHFLLEHIRKSAENAQGETGIVATGISESEQPGALVFLNEDDWTVPESGAPTYAARLACTRWLSQCLEFGWRKDQLDGLEKIWWQHHDRNGVLVKPDKAVSPPSQAKPGSGWSKGNLNIQVEHSEGFEWLIKTNDLITDASQTLFEDGGVTEEGICLITPHGNIALTVSELRRIIEEVSPPSQADRDGFTQDHVQEGFRLGYNEAIDNICDELNATETPVRVEDWDALWDRIIKLKKPKP